VHGFGFAVALLLEVVLPSADVVAVPAEAPAFLQFFSLRFGATIACPVAVKAGFFDFFASAVIGLQDFGIGFAAVFARVEFFPIEPLFPA
jgi:hypothetical protein